MSGQGGLFEAVRKVVGDKPTYLLAGASDLVSEKLRELPEALGSLQSEYRDLPMRAAGALVGQAFRANLKIGALYDDLTRRGEEVVAKTRGDAVYAEEDEPFVREPFLPEPVHRAEASEPAVATPPTKKTVAKQPAAEKPAAKKTPSKKAPVKRAPTKRAPAKPGSAPGRRRPASEA